MDNVVSSTTPCEMGDISDLEVPALLEDDGNVDKACRKELEDVSKSANAVLPFSKSLTRMQTAN
jgi:hypothetical protein